MTSTTTEQPTADTREAKDLARAKENYDSLLQGFQTIHLATIAADGKPEASYAPAILDETGSFQVYVSELSAHTANLLASGKASVLIIEDEAASPNIFARRRVTFDCTAAEIERHSAEWSESIDRFADKFGKTMNVLRDMADFHLIRLRPDSARLVIGFGRAYDIQGDTIVHVRGNEEGGHRKDAHGPKDTTPFTAEDVERMVGHMNEDHTDSILAYVHYFGKCPEATDGRMLDVTPNDMRIEAVTPAGTREIVIPFERTLVTAHDVHMALVQMSKKAKKALG